MTTDAQSRPEASDEPNGHRFGALWWFLLALLLIGGFYLLAWLATRYEGDDQAEVTAVAPAVTTTAPPPSSPEPDAPPAASPTTSTNAPAETTIAALLAGDPQFSELGARLLAAGLVGPLGESGEYTLFAPTNEAFDNATPSELTASVDNQARGAEVLSYHLVDGAADASRDGSAVSVLGEELSFAGGRLNGSAEIGEPISTGNGVVYPIDFIQVPPSLAEQVILESSLNQLFELDPIQFELGSSVITPQSRVILDEAVVVLTRAPGTVTIEGHTDDQGNDAANQSLSEERATAVRQYLVDNGIDAARLTTVGFGASQPIASNSTPEGRAENRRITFRAG